MQSRRLQHRQKENGHRKGLGAKGQDRRTHNQRIRQKTDLLLEIRNDGLAENLRDSLLTEKFRGAASLQNQRALMFGHMDGRRSALRVETK